MIRPVVAPARLRLARRLASTCLVVALGLIPAAQAQDPANPPVGLQAPTESEADSPEDEESGPRERPAEIEEITVTARRRAENIQDTPVSITALGSLALEERGVTDVRELTQFVPNLKFDATTAGSQTARIFIRGIGQEDGGLAKEPGVGLYVDGVFYARSSGSILSLVDIERVEVLRGPQGVVNGKNAIGGAINIISKKPHDELGASSEVTVGNLDLLRTQFKLNVPIAIAGLEDRVFARFSFGSETRDGFIDDKFQRRPFYDAKMLAGRTSLRILPRDDLDLLFTYEQVRRHEREPRGHCRIIEPESGVENPFSFPNILAFPFSSVTLGGDFKELCNQSDALGEFTTLTDLPKLLDLDTWGTTGTIDWDTPELPLLGSLNLKSITAWRGFEQGLNLELDSTSLRVLHAEVPKLRYDEIQQELQLNGAAFDDRLNWVGGLFYFHEYSGGDPSKGFIAVPNIYYERENGVRVERLWVEDALDFAQFIAFVDGESFSQFDHITRAAYLQATYSLTDRLELTGGARRSHERKETDRWQAFIPSALEIDLGTGEPTGGVLFGEPESDSANNSERFNSWTGLVNLTYGVTDDLMVYAGWSRGFRSGGFNDTITTTGLVDTFDPETLENNEVGFKTTWFDRRLLVNGSFFYNRYDDMQVKTRVVDLTTGSGSRVATLNIGDGTLSGLELEAMAVPTEGLVLNANVGLLHGKYRSFLYLDQDATEDALDLDPGAAPVFRDLSSNEWQHTPPWNYNLRVAYSFPLFDLGELTLAANYYSQGEVHYNIRNFDGLKQSKYGIWGSQLSLLLNDERTKITFWVKNLADRSYLTGGFHTDDLGFENRYYDGRRTYGLTVSRSFGGE